VTLIGRFWVTPEVVACHVCRDRQFLRRALSFPIMYADLGDKNQAFRWLNTAHQERDLYLLKLNTDFLLTPYVPTHGFAELVQKVGLPL